MSFLAEGERFLRFLRDVLEGGPLQPVYGIDGRRDLPEEKLPHLAGFGGNGHVRIGNAAALQNQHDLAGEMILCFETLLSDPRIVHDDEAAYWPLVRRLVQTAIELAPLPDTGIWELRTAARHHTFSRAMCWVATDRGARLAARFGEGALAETWRAIADRERAEILARGYSAERGYFTQALDGLYPDASNLLLAPIGLVAPTDPRFVSTVRAYKPLLAPSGLMLRYGNDDDFGRPASAFTICSFWWAEALALIGQVDEAIEVFERAAGHANEVGLLSEDVDPRTGTLLGNFPQAYTHVGLVHAAMTIGALLDARGGRFHAWG
jgi:GH15 family glucan-1,4-alpha-glucosidase